jgi:hypothetical protein
MHARDVAQQLEALAGSREDFATLTYDLTDSWLAAGIGIEVVEPVLRFMENHPSLDYGSPGSLVHFVERFNGPAYLEALSASLERTPTAHTAWMLNRVANAAPTQETRAMFIALMERATRNPAASEDAVAALTRFLDCQRGLMR